MSADTTPVYAAAQTRPRSALAKLTLTEARLLLREPVALFWGLAFSMALLAVMGLASSGPQSDLGGLRLVAVYEPILIAFVTVAFAIQGLPGVVAGYRERRILRRMATTPVGPVRVVAAQLAVNLAVALAATAGILTVGRLGFGVALPGQPAGFLVTYVLAAIAMLGLGMLIAALAPTGRAAGVIGTMLFFPLMFFAGLWIPRATMPASLREVSDFTPLGAAVQALQDSLHGSWPHPSALAVLAGYAVVFTVAAARFFRWD
jgi:ABC-2 type transport system permease protein